MSTAVIRVVRCDRCGAEQNADTVTSIPSGWVQLTGADRYETKHLCSPCKNRALKVRA